MVDEMNLALFNKIRRHVYEHHSKQVGEAQDAINGAVDKLRGELQAHLEEVKPFMSSSLAAQTTVQNIID